MNTLCHCGRILFENASDFMVREGHACRGDCKARKGGLLPRTHAETVSGGGNANGGLEDLLGQHLDLHGIPYEREFRFAPPRRWRSDFHLTGTMFLIECHGLIYQQAYSRHQTYSGLEGDLIKMNAAVLAGWKPLCFSGRQIRNGEALNQIVEAVKEI